MSDTTEYLKEQYERAKKIGSNPDIPVGDAVKQVLGEAKSEFSAASTYAQCRKQRKANVAKHLKELRMACGLRQQDVAERTGINVITLSGYELARSEPNIEALVRLADVYNVSLDNLMCRTRESDSVKSENP